MNGKGKGTKQSRASSAGSQSNEQKRIRNARRGAGFVADWANAEASFIAGVVCAVSARGCAVQFGYTRDKDSYRIRIVGDGEPFEEYLRATEDLNVWLEGLATDYRL